MFKSTRQRWGVGRAYATPDQISPRGGMGGVWAARVAREHFHAAPLSRVGGRSYTTVGGGYRGVEVLGFRKSCLGCLRTLPKKIYRRAYDFLVKNRVYPPFLTIFDIFAPPRFFFFANGRVNQFGIRRKAHR